jgi:hypothetical protein
LSHSGEKGGIAMLTVAGEMNGRKYKAKTERRPNRETSVECMLSCPRTRGQVTCLKCPADESLGENVALHKLTGVESMRRPLFSPHRSSFMQERGERLASKKPQAQRQNADRGPACCRGAVSNACVTSFELLCICPEPSNIPATESAYCLFGAPSV